MASWHGLDDCLGTSGLLRKRCVSSANRHLRLVHNVCQTHRAAGEIRQKRTSAYKRDGLYHAAERFAGTGALTANCCISHSTRTVPNTPKLTYSQWQIFDRMRIGVLTSTGTELRRKLAKKLARRTSRRKRSCTSLYANLLLPSASTHFPTASSRRLTTIILGVHILKNADRSNDE